MDSMPTMRDLDAALESFKGGRILILGDLILDEYLYGSTQRISREAPVLIVRHEETLHSPGGAANTAVNVASLGGTVLPLGLVGDDAEGRRLVDLLAERGIDTGGILVEGDLRTTTKTRIMAGDFHTQRQQVLRVDRESRGAVKETARLRLLGALADYVDHVDAVLLADYGLGSLDAATAQKAIGLARNQEVPVLADSRFDLLAYDGATALTPNESELFAALEISPTEEVSIETAAADLMTRLHAPSIVVTRGSLGMLVLERGQPSRHIPIAGSDQVTDLSGAGDTVAAVIALALARGIALVQGALIASFAAGVVVMKRGTAAVSPREILDCIERVGPLPIT